MITIHELAAKDEGDYATFLAGRPEGLFYSSLAYRSFLADLLGCETSYRLARDENGRIVGILPIMVREGPRGRVINSLPFYGSHGGVLADDAEAAASLVDAFDRLADGDGVAASVWIDHPFAPPAVSPRGTTHGDVRISQITALPPGDDVATLFDAIDASARRNIKKAEREGVTVRVDNERMDFLELTHRENMESIGGRAKAPAFFAKIADHFVAGDDYRLWLAEQGQEPVAALLLFYFNRTVEYFVPATLNAARTLQPMAAILEAAMTDAAQRGYRRWNWGGTWTSQDGVWRFKHKWGAVDRQYRYHIRVTNPDLLEATPDELSRDYPGFYTVPFAALRGRPAHG